MNIDQLKVKQDVINELIAEYDAKGKEEMVRELNIMSDVYYMRYLECEVKALRNRNQG